MLLLDGLPRSVVFLHHTIAIFFSGQRFKEEGEEGEERQEGEEGEEGQEGEERQKGEEGEEREEERFEA
jgi:hypothetical protein